MAAPIPGCATAARCWRSRACRTKGFFPAPNMDGLAAAYQFLRHLEHRLQFDDDRQTHTLAGRSGGARAARPAHAWRWRLGRVADARNQRALRAGVGDLRARGAFAGRRTLGSGACGTAVQQRGAVRWSSARPRFQRSLADSGSAAWLSRLRTFSGTDVGAIRPRLERLNADPDLAAAHARSVRAQPVFRRRTDPHAGAAGRSSAGAPDEDEPTPQDAARAAPLVSARDAAHPGREHLPTRSRFSKRWSAPPSWPTR